VASMAALHRTGESDDIKPVAEILASDELGWTPVENVDVCMIGRCGEFLGCNRVDGC
jgi:hypothetical protein